MRAWCSRPLSRPNFASALSLVLLVAPTATLGQIALPSPAFQPAPASSGAVPSNSSGTPNAQWKNLLGDLLWFYEAQRSGHLPDSNRVSWRNDSALDDVPAGGYYDAGDYLKFTYPLTWTLTSVCWGALNYGKGYESSDQAAYLDGMLRWGLDWLMAAHPDNNTLIVQVGDADIDNNYWGGDQNIPTPRPSYQINSTNPGTDAAAVASAAFTSCSMLYSQTSLLLPSLTQNNTNLSSVVSPPSSLANSSYSSQLLSHGEALYNFASTASPQQVYQTAVPAVASSYGSSGYEDDLVLAGLFLSVATPGGNSTAYAAAKQLWDSDFKGKGQTSGVLNWDGKAPMLPVLGAQIVEAYADVVGAGSGDLDDFRSVTETYLDGVVSEKLTRGGLLYYDSDSPLASLNPALNAAMLLTQYLPLVQDSGRANKYSAFAAKQLNYALGANPMSMPYIVGVNPNSPANPHSAQASGGSDIGDIDNSPPNEAYVLYGAVVGGPNKRDYFWDIRSDYPETEVGLDYNAPLLTLAAASILTQTSDPYYVSLQAGAYDSKRPNGQPCDEAISGDCSGGWSKGGEIAMAVIISVVGLALFGGIVYLFYVGARESGGKVF